MSDLAGYISSFLVSLGLALGFVVAGAIAAFLITYGATLFFKRFRGLMREDEKRTQMPGKNRMVPLRVVPKKTAP